MWGDEMKYLRFELVREGEYPIIRVTYLKFKLFKKNEEISRDVINSGAGNGWWKFMDNDEFTFKFTPINNFYKSGLDFYIVNKQKNVRISR